MSKNEAVVYVKAESKCFNCILSAGCEIRQQIIQLETKQRFYRRQLVIYVVQCDIWMGLI